MRRVFLVMAVIPVIVLAGCGKSETKAPAGKDECANAVPSIAGQTSAQAVEQCRNNKKFFGAPDAKPSNRPITNN
jgi:hypothetical protein